MIEHTLLTKRGAAQNILLVEGSDDAHVMRSLFSIYGIPHVYPQKGKADYEQLRPGQIEIRDHMGFDNLLESFEVELKRSGDRQIGIVVDVDNDISARWASLRDKLIRIGYNIVPGVPDSSGTIVQQEDKTPVGLWLMPDNTLAGMLEDFVSQLVPSDDVLWPIAERVLQEVVTKERRFPEAHYSKARIHTWLAWQKKPGKPMGQAITAHYLDSSSLHAQLFISWVRRFFAL